MTVLIASCIRQKPEILSEFLESLDKLEKPCEPHYFFVTTLEEESKRLLEGWAVGKDVTIREEKVDEQFIVDEDTHHWTSEHVKTLMRLRDIYLDEARKGEYGHLFAADSDIYFHPETLVRLLHNRKDIITEIHWTKWYADNSRILPNVWFYDNYGFPADGLQRLRSEKLVKVGGICGAYLISKKALKAGVSFAIAKGVPEHWGEDRHFAVRAKSLGFDLWVDTVYPSFHIYRLSDLPRLRSWKARGFKFIEESLMMQPGTVLIAVCVGVRGIHEDTAAWLAKTIRDHPDWGLEISRGHPIDSNRNSIVKKFRILSEAQKFEWLLFVDSDVVPPVGAVERLLSRGKKIVGGVCTIMNRDGSPIPNFAKDLGPGYIAAQLLEVEGMGTGCMLIHRDVLEAVGKSPFRYQYDEWGVANVSGEDYDFCAKAVKAGYEIYADLTVQCEHYKTVGLLKINKLLEKVAESTTER